MGGPVSGQVHAGLWHRLRRGHRPETRAPCRLPPRRRLDRRPFPAGRCARLDRSKTFFTSIAIGSTGKNEASDEELGAADFLTELAPDTVLGIV
jgi:hypothetical protein